MQIVHSACALLIGNELLSGKVRDENLHALATTLRALGIPLSRALFLRDEPQELVREIREQSARHDLVITSGGVGPTHDDVTLAAVAAAFDVQCEISAELMLHLEQGFARRAAASPAHAALGSSANPGQLRMARIPEGSRLLHAPDAVWPTIVKGNVWMLPGVPELFRLKLLGLREYVRGPEPFYTRNVFTQLEELELTTLLDAIVSAHPEVEVGSYPKWFDPTYKTKITLDARSEAAVEAALAALLAGMPKTGVG